MAWTTDSGKPNMRSLSFELSSTHANTFGYGGGASELIAGRKSDPAGGRVRFRLEDKTAQVRTLGDRYKRSLDEIALVVI
jgi:hypothetical protein